MYTGTADLIRSTLLCVLSLAAEVTGTDKIQITLLEHSNRQHHIAINAIVYSFLKAQFQLQRQR